MKDDDLKLLFLPVSLVILSSKMINYLGVQIYIYKIVCRLVLNKIDWKDYSITQMSGPRVIQLIF